MSEKFKNRVRALSPAKIFVFAMFISVVVYFAIYIAIGNGRFSDMFFKRCADLFMDLFNSIRDASRGSGVYTERRVIYPPMANLIFLILSRFTPNVYNDTTFEERFEWSAYFPIAMMTVMFCCVFAILFFFIVYTKIKTESKVLRFCFAFFAFFSTPVLYMLERGNMILFCVLALMVYAFSYNSESKVSREIGLLALAFAFSVKLYPVVFGWFLLADKRYKDAIRCAVYGVLMLIIPSFFFGGPVCFVWLFNNIFRFSSGSGNTLSIILNFLGLPPLAQGIITALAYVWVLVCAVCFAVSPFIKRERYKIWALGLVTIQCVPSLTSLYGWAFFIIPIVLLCNKNKLSAYLPLMTVPFLLLPFRINYYVAVVTVAVYVTTAILSVWCVCDTIKDLSRSIKDRKQKAVT